MHLYNVDYFELKANETLETPEKLLPTSFTYLEECKLGALPIISCLAGQTTHSWTSALLIVLQRPSEFPRPLTSLLTQNAVYTFYSWDSHGWGRGGVSLIYVRFPYVHMYSFLLLICLVYIYLLDQPKEPWGCRKVSSSVARHFLVNEEKPLEVWYKQKAQGLKGSYTRWRENGLEKPVEPRENIRKADGLTLPGTSTPIPTAFCCVW